jgi:SAM-dependent methyltransferase
MGKSKRSWRVLEPACGSGRLVAEMARRGHGVWGFDLNENMLDYARDRLANQKLDAKLWPDCLEDFKAPVRHKFDLAHCLVSTFKYVLAEAGAGSHLKRVAACLRPGGLYVLGLHLTDYRSRCVEHERWVAERDGIRVVCNTRTWPADRRSRLEKVRTRLRISRNGKSWMQETHWQFRTYNAAEVKRWLRVAPELELVACHDFRCDMTEIRRLDDSYADVILILRRR